MQGLTAENFYQTGLSHYSKGHYKEAIIGFNQALSQNPSNTNTRYYLADSYLKLNRLNLAENQYRTIIRMAPESQAARLSQLALTRLSKFLQAQKQGQSSSVSALKQNNGQRLDRYTGGMLPDSQKNNYLERVKEAGQYIRWSLVSGPVKVYVEEKPENINNFEPGFYNSVRKAFLLWSNALGRQLEFNWINAPFQADIEVSWINAIDKNGNFKDGETTYTAGLTTPTIQNDRLEKMSIQIATFDIQNKPQTAETIYAVAIHEIGHSLGLMGHSDVQTDIMSPQNALVTKLTDRDLNTIRLLYQLNPDISNLEPGSKTVSKERRIALTAALDKAIVDAEKKANTQDDALSWENLGILYFQKANKLRTSESSFFEIQKAQQRLFFKAKLAFEKASQKEPENSGTLNKLSIAYQGLGDFNMATKTIRKAIALDPKKAEYHKMLAWYLSQQGQKAEARSELDIYLREYPESAGTEEVQRILDALR
ncbi:MAG: tetratricopeptide repeat protein [Cyanobacteria bacterium P01_H01_bin.74]